RRSGGSGRTMAKARPQEAADAPLGEAQLLLAGYYKIVDCGHVEFFLAPRSASQEWRRSSPVSRMVYGIRSNSLTAAFPHSMAVVRARRGARAALGAGPRRRLWRRTRRVAAGAPSGAPTIAAGARRPRPAESHVGLRKRAARSTLTP